MDPTAVSVAWIAASAGIIAGVVAAIRIFLDSRAGAKTAWFARQERYYERLEERQGQLERRVEERDDEIDTLNGQVMDLRLQLIETNRYVRMLRGLLEANGIPVPTREEFEPWRKRSDT